MTDKSMLLYIHGFNSSPLSLKARIMQDYCEQHRPDIRVVVPQLPCFPAEAAKLLSGLVEKYQSDYRIGLVGSSLGGYLSTWLNSRYGLRAVLVNPAVRPFELLTDYLGEQINPYTQQKYQLEEHHMNELKALDIPVVSHPEDF